MRQYDSEQTDNHSFILLSSLVTDFFCAFLPLPPTPPFCCLSLSLFIDGHLWLEGCKQFLQHKKKMGEKVECNMLVLGDEANLVIF